jgi:serpin B
MNNPIRLNLLMLACLFNCGAGLPPPPGETIRSEKQRITEAAPADDLRQGVDANNTLGLSLLKLTPATENAVVSPYSVNMAMSMVYGGAKGETASGIAAGLHLTLPAERHHRAINTLNREVASRGKGAQSTKGTPFALRINNQLFADNGTTPRQTYLDLLATEYGAGVQRLDFQGKPEQSRQAINQWVEKNTEQLIAELIPEGVIRTDTRFTLVNTVYLDAAWKQPFDKADTRDLPFRLSNGSSKNVVTMSGRLDNVRSLSNEAIDAVEIPYQGDEVALVVLAPKKDSLDAFEKKLNVQSLKDIDGQMKSSLMMITLPKFSLDAKRELLPYFQGAGLPIGTQDFTGIADLNLEISNILHQTVLRVDEAGTVAAAATAVVIREVSAPQPLTIDRPFIFMLKDLKSQAVLFVGRVVEPK